MTVDGAGCIRGGSDSSSTCSWSRDEDRAFENVIASWEEGDGEDLEWSDLSQLWARLAGEFPGKSLEEIRCHYEVLVKDVRLIDAGWVEIPRYDNGFEGLSSGGVDGKEGGLGNGGGGGGKEVVKVSRSEHERRKGIAWSEEEQRTLTQVASHAQKYFIRLNSVNKDRQRPSIHDITSVDTGDPSTSHNLITGQTNGTSESGGGSENHSKGSPPAIGQPVDGPYTSAIRSQPTGVTDLEENPLAGKDVK